MCRVSLTPENRPFIPKFPHDDFTSSADDTGCLSSQALSSQHGSVLEVHTVLQAQSWMDPAPYHRFRKYSGRHYIPGNAVDYELACGANPRF